MNMFCYFYTSPLRLILALAVAFWLVPFDIDGYSMKLRVTFLLGVAVTITVTLESVMLKDEVTEYPDFQSIETTSGSGAPGRGRNICAEEMKFQMN